MTKKELAIQLRNQGYNCCQAVVCAFCEELGLDEETLFRAAEGFGSGMGGMKGTCGAISGAVMAAGFVNSIGHIQTPPSKIETQKLSKEIMEKFIAKNGASSCEDLKGVKTGEVLRSCPGCVEDAVDLVSEILHI